MGQDRALADEPHLGVNGLENDPAAVSLGQAAVEIVSDAGRHLDLEAAHELAAGIDTDDVAVDLEREGKIADADESLEILVPSQHIGKPQQNMAGLIENGFDAHQIEHSLGGNVDRPGTALIDPEGSSVPCKKNGRGLFAPFDILDREIMAAAVFRRTPFDIEKFPVLKSLQDFLHESGIFGIRSVEAAPDDLNEGAGRIFDKETVDLNLHLRTDDIEAELEPGETSRQIEDAAGLQDGFVGRSGLEVLGGLKHQFAGTSPLRRTFDGRFKLEEVGRGRSGLSRGIHEKDPDFGLAGHRSRCIGADIAVPFLGPGVGLFFLLRLAALDGENRSDDQ